MNIEYYDTNRELMERLDRDREEVRKAQRAAEEMRQEEMRQENIRELEREMREAGRRYYKAWKQGTKEADQQGLKGYARRRHIGGTRGVAHLRYEVDEIIGKLRELDPRNSDIYDVPVLEY